MSLFKGFIYFVMDILETIVFVGSMFIVIYLYLVQPNQVKGQSMTNTFQDQDYIFTSKITYRLRPPERGDVVVIHAPKESGQDYSTEFIKRVIGLPGDTLTFTHCTDADPEKVDCDVNVNGSPLTEPYLRAKTKLFFNSKYKEDEPVVIPQGDIFVMGDNRPGSMDSRFFGPVSEKDIIGVVFFRYLPLNEMGLVKNPFHPK